METHEKSTIVITSSVRPSVTKIVALSKYPIHWKPEKKDDARSHMVPPQQRVGLETAEAAEVPIWRDKHPRFPFRMSGRNGSESWPGTLSGPPGRRPRHRASDAGPSPNIGAIPGLGRNFAWGHEQKTVDELAGSVGDCVARELDSTAIWRPAGPPETPSGASSTLAGRTTSPMKFKSRKLEMSGVATEPEHPGCGPNL